MEDFIQEIDKIIIDSSKEINDKILGINYLEKLKYLLIDKLKTININSFINLKNNELNKEYGQNHLLVRIINYEDSVSKIKQVLKSDYLCLVIIGSKTVEIHKNLNSKISSILNIFPKTGISLSNNTIISESISKGTILLDIFNIEVKSDIEN